MNSPPLTFAVATSATKDKLSKTKQNRLDIMQAIHKAAISEFSLHGFAGASTQAIAERAGLKKSQLHYYIEDKEALYLQVLGDLMTRWSVLANFDNDQYSPEQCLSDYIREKLDFALDNPELSRIFTSELLSGGHRVSEFWPEAIRNTELKIAKIEEWIADGKIRPLNARLLIMHIWAMTQYYADYAIQAKVILQDPIDTPEMRAHILANLVDLVLHGCGLLPAPK